MNFATKRAPVQSTLILDGLPAKAAPAAKPASSPLPGSNPVAAPDDVVRIAAKLRAQLSKHDQVLLFAGVRERSGVAQLVSQVALTFTHLDNSSVLVVDADLTHPSLHERCEVPLSPGLSEGIVGEVTPPAVMRAATSSPLFVVPAGNRKLDTRALFTSPEFPPFIDALRAQFRFVMINVAPVLAEVNASLICPVVDGVVLAAPTGKEHHGELRTARDEIRALNTRVLGLVLFDEMAGKRDTR